MEIVMNRFTMDESGILNIDTLHHDMGIWAARLGVIQRNPSEYAIMPSGDHYILRRIAPYGTSYFYRVLEEDAITIQQAWLEGTGNMQIESQEASSADSEELIYNASPETLRQTIDEAVEELNISPEAPTESGFVQELERSIRESLGIEGASNDDLLEAIEALPESDEDSTTESPSNNPLPDINEVEPTPVIPPNSGSIMVEESTSRFSSAIWYDNIRAQNIIIAGVGGIGSYVGYMLARMKPNYISIYDDDVVEEGNMSGQFYNVNDVGSYKVNALAKMMREYCLYNNVIAYPEKFTETSESWDVMICGFDNMKARRTFFNSWKRRVESYPEEARDKCLFIDGRLAAEEFQVFCITGDDKYSIERFEEDYLFSDLDADATVCSYKQTTFMANMIGSFIVNLFTNFAANQCNPLIDRELPFFTEYSAENMYLKIER